MVVTRAPAARRGQHGARLHRDAIDQHQAGAALRGVAADMGAGEAQVVAQELDQQRAVLDIGRDRLAVDGHFHDGTRALLLRW